METVLEPTSGPGERALELAGHHAAAFEELAASWDAARRFPAEAVAAMQASSLAAVTVPTRLGGGGVDQLRDVMAVAHLVAQGDSSLGICTNMHLSFCWSLARAAANLDERSSELAEGLLRGVADGAVWFCAAVTEAGTNYFHPATTLEADRHGVWRVRGTKVFATGSPVASHLTTNVRVRGGPRHDHLATVIVPTDRAGVEVVDDWAGLGMRASGSGRVRFHDVEIDADVLILPGGPWGRFTAASVQGRAFGNVGNIAAMGGIASAAARASVARVRGEGRVSAAALAERPTVRHALGVLEIELATVRAVLGQLGHDADRRAALPAADLAEAHRFMARFQAAKVEANRRCISIVDHALELAGGSGYLDDHPVGRRYRDVRAGPFMQPFTPHEAIGYLGAVAAGVEPDVLA
ncbi:MAG: acyl-CoA/acyl-ACP dehydrogenase [Acidimicrobiia bacterium]|nr:acyl-CoA/acyl-ACP dehydrogenase [Acidimicrobiia bacterium]